MWALKRSIGILGVGPNLGRGEDERNRKLHESKKALRVTYRHFEKLIFNQSSFKFSHGCQTVQLMPTFDEVSFAGTLSCDHSLLSYVGC